MIKSPVVLTTTLLLAAVAFPQTSSDMDCLNILRGVYEHLSLLEDRSRDRGLYLSFTTTTTTSEAQGGRTRVTPFSVYAGAGAKWFISEEMEIYQDKKHSVTIIPQDKLIYVRDYTADPRMGTAVGQFAQLNEKLLSLSTVTACEDFLADANIFKRIRLEQHQEGREAFKTLYVDFEVDPRQKTLRKTVTRYVEGQPLVTMSVHLNELDENFPLDELSQPVIQKVIGSDERILPSYTGYRVLDSRVRPSDQRN